MERRLRTIVAALALVACIIPFPPAARGAEEPLRLISSTSITERLRELTFHSQALGRETAVRVLLPKGFDKDKHLGDPLPVLWLLHGCCDDYKSWADRGGAEKLTEGLDLVVVMPDGGKGGWYSDWYNGGRNGPPAWETYHLTELRYWLEANLPVRTDRGGRAIAGLSMGGFGALVYAARHPDLFSVAAAYSGAVDTNISAISSFTDYSAAMDGAPAGAIWGPRNTDEIRWHAHNPIDLAPNLASVGMFLRTGNGLPGGRYGGSLDVLEIGVHQAMVGLHQRLVGLNIQHAWDDYGPGAHQWPYWAEGLALTLPRVIEAAKNRSEAPATVSHIAYEPNYSVWDFTVRLDRTVLETSKLDIRPNGFTLTGSGRGTVITPSRFTPGSPVDATSGPRKERLKADPDGRVVVPVDLGAAGTQGAVEITLDAVGEDPPPLRTGDVHPGDDSALPTVLIALGAIALAAAIGVVIVLSVARRRPQNQQQL